MLACFQFIFLNVDFKTEHVPEVRGCEHVFPASKLFQYLKTILINFLFFCYPFLPPLPLVIDLFYSSFFFMVPDALSSPYRTSHWSARIRHQ
jgi:hypothetical protein